MNTLLKDFEFVYYSPVRRDYPTGYIAQHISRIEKLLFRKCFGFDFYKVLLEDLIEPEYICYKRGNTYTLNQVVELDGILYKNTVASNATNPTLLDDWEVVKKFTTDIYNELWDDLKYLLAYYVHYTSINYSTNQSGSRGLVQFGEDSTSAKGAAKEDLSDFKRELLNDIRTYISNLKDFINEDETDAFDLCFLKEKGRCYDKYCCDWLFQSRRVLMR